MRKPATVVSVRGADGQQRAGHGPEVKGLIQVLTVTRQGQRGEGGDLVLGDGCLPSPACISCQDSPHQSVAKPSTCSFLPLKVPGSCCWSNAAAPAQAGKLSSLSSQAHKIYTQSSGESVGRESDCLVWILTLPPTSYEPHRPSVSSSIKWGSGGTYFIWLL